MGEKSMGASWSFATSIAHLIIREEKVIRHRTYKSMVDELFKYATLSGLSNDAVECILSIFRNEGRQDLVDLVLQYRKENEGDQSNTE